MKNKNIRQIIMKRKYTIIIWIVVIIYGLFIFPYPEKFPILSNRVISFGVLLLGLSTFFYKKK